MPGKAFLSVRARCGCEEVLTFSSGIAGDFGDFGVGEAVEEGHFQGLALLGGEGLDNAAGALHQGVSLSLVGEVGGGGERDIVDIDGGALAAQGIDGAVARNDSQPAAENRGRR